MHRVKSASHMRVAQASTYKSFTGRHPPSSVDSIWIAAVPRLFWVTSRQAPDTIWVDRATPRAVYAFGQRDTSGYPHQKYLDHGDLVDAYREQYENQTMPADCIGRKGVGGDYFPTEQCIADIVEHVRSGVLTTHHCMHDMWCSCQHDVLLRVMNCVAYVICAEGEVGQHFRDFVSGAAGDQDLDGFDDLDSAQERAGEQRDQDGVDAHVPAADELLPARGEGEEGAHAAEDAEAERIILEATAFGVDSDRSASRPAHGLSGSELEQPEEPEQEEPAQEEPEPESGEGIAARLEGVLPKPQLSFSACMVSTFLFCHAKRSNLSTLLCLLQISRQAPSFRGLSVGKRSGRAQCSVCPPQMTRWWQTLSGSMGLQNLLLCSQVCTLIHHCRAHAQHTGTCTTQESTSLPPLSYIIC